MNELFKTYVKIAAKKDSPVGDLANDILSDKAFPFDRDEEGIFRYLQLRAYDYLVQDALKKFKVNYNAWLNGNVKENLAKPNLIAKDVEPSTAIDKATVIEIENKGERAIIHDYLIMGIPKNSATVETFKHDADNKVFLNLSKLWIDVNKFSEEGKYFTFTLIIKYSDIDSNVYEKTFYCKSNIVIGNYPVLR